MQYWLMKSEPGCFSIQDLKKSPKKTTHWDGVRNYQVRNMMRDQMKIGDKAFFYHSACKVPGIAGTMTVVKEGYPDHTAFDLEDEHYDPKSDRDNPRWHMVDVKLDTIFDELITLSELRTHKALEGMKLLQKGSRLSVTPLSKREWDYIMKLSCVEHA